MDGSGPRGRATDTHFAAELGMGAGHECSQLFVARLHELQVARKATEGADDAVDAVARIAVNAAHAPRVQASQQKIAHCGSHVAFFAGAARVTRRLESLQWPCLQKAAALSPARCTTHRALVRIT